MVNNISPGGSYLCIPSWDATCAWPEELDTACAFLEDKAKKGPVLVHCASGKGRSVSMICAALVHAGKFDSLEAAHAACKEKRKVSNIFTSPLQGPMLRAWVKQRASKSKKTSAGFH